MAKDFDPSTLSASDQQAFRDWQQQLRQYVAQSGGGVPAPVTYALAHPDYLKDHPELRDAYNLVSGATLPATTRTALKGFHPNWSGGNAGMSKDSGLWNKWETWLQLGLGGAVGYEVIPAIAGAGGGTAGASAAGTAGTAGTTAGATVPALEGGTTLATNLGGAGALEAGGAATGGTMAGLGVEGGSTLAQNLGSSSALGPSAAGPAPAAASTGKSFWDALLGDTKAKKIATAASLGAGLLGNYIQSRQIDKATQAQVDAANRALALQQNIYQQQRADLAPYRGLGSGAAQFLSQGLGLPAATDTTIPAFQPAAPMQQAQRNPNSPATTPVPAANYTGQQAVPRSMAGLGDGGLVNMVSPDGRPARVPQAQVQAALAAGGRLA